MQLHFLVSSHNFLHFLDYCKLQAIRQYPRVRDFLGLVKALAQKLYENFVPSDQLDMETWPVSAALFSGTLLIEIDLASVEWC